MEKSHKTSAPGAVLLSLQASGFAVMVLVLLVTGVIVLSPTLSILAEQQQEISSLEVALLESQQEVFNLEEQRERWKDPAFVETQARERLLFVYPGDITYLVIDDVGEDADVHDIAVSTTLLAASTDWRVSAARVLPSRRHNVTGVSHTRRCHDSLPGAARPVRAPGGASHERRHCLRQ